VTKLSLDMLKENNWESDLQKGLHQFRQVVVIFEDLGTISSGQYNSKSLFSISLYFSPFW